MWSNYKQILSWSCHKINIFGLGINAESAKFAAELSRNPLNFIPRYRRIATNLSRNSPIPESIQWWPFCASVNSSLTHQPLLSNLRGAAMGLELCKKLGMGRRKIFCTTSEAHLFRNYISVKRSSDDNDITNYMTR